MPLLVLYLRVHWQGLTLSLQTRGPKRSFDKNKWSKTGFLVIIHVYMSHPDWRVLLPERRVV